jgi:uncharacterized protein YciI
MLYVIHCFDKDNHLELRQEVRPEHVAYLKGFGSRIWCAGPTLNDTEDMDGSVIVIECENMSEAEDFAANDPYAKAGLFREVLIQKWKKVLPAD